MTEPIKLTESDFSFIHWEKDSGGSEQFVLMIHGKSKPHCDKIKQQILENQEVVHDIQEFVKRKPHTEEEKAINKCLKEILRENNIGDKS